jgi:hypothetical protein
MLSRFLAGRPGVRLALSAIPFLIILIPMFRVPVITVLQAQVQPAPGAAADLEGELEVEVEDSTTGSRIHHFINVKGKRVRLSGLAAVPGWQTGTKVRARGQLRNNELQLAGGGSLQALALASPNTFGQQRVAVILVNFQNNMTQPYTAATAHSVTFGQTNQFYLDNSYGQTSLTGQVFGWYTLPMSMPGTCDYNTIAAQADQVATANGVNLSQFTRKVYAFPQISACGWWGLGTVGGNPSRSWVNGSYQVKVVGHELGHNFGLWHSNSMNCSTSGCSAVEYGDDRDMMGLSSVGHFNAFQKERLGWLSYGTSPTVQSITSAGTYWIEGYGATSNGGPKALRILQSTDGTGKRTWYYVESRARIGFDNGFAAGVTVHTGSESTGNSSYQVDLSPSTTTYDSLLDVGQVFADPSIDLAIKTISASDAGAFVEISYPGVPCTAGVPSVTLSPSNATTQPGKAVGLTVSIRNNDSTSGCDATTFSLSASTPLGWPFSYALPSLTIAPGATSSTSLTVTPSSTGTGAVTSSVARVNTSGPGSSASAAITATSSLSVSLAIAKSNAYQISANVKAGSNLLANVPVAFSLRNPAGKVTAYSSVTNASGVAKITVRLKGKDPKGTYSVTATATSGSLSGSASGTFAY